MKIESPTYAELATGGARKPHNGKRPTDKAGRCFQTGAIKLRKPSKSAAMRLHGAGLLSDRALTQLFATRAHWGHE